MMEKYIHTSIFQRVLFDSKGRCIGTPDHPFSTLWKIQVYMTSKWYVIVPCRCALSKLVVYQRTTGGVLPPPWFGSKMLHPRAVQGGASFGWHIPATWAGTKHWNRIKLLPRKLYHLERIDGSTPISLGLSYPLTNRHQTWGVASHLLSRWYTNFHLQIDPLDT